MTEWVYQRIWAAAAWPVIAFVLAPLIVVVLGSFTEKEYLSLPLDGISFRWYAAIFDYWYFLDGFIKSLQLGIVAALAATTLGALAAIGLSRTSSHFVSVFSVLLFLPLMVPSVIIAMALLQYFSFLHITSPYVTLFAGHTVITVPYVVRAVAASLRMMERNTEWAAANLGANPWQVVWRVTLPSIRPGVVGGLIFAFVVSFDTVTISLFLQTPTYIPLPVRLYNFVESGVSPVLAALSTLLILFSAGGIYLAERIVGLKVVFGARN